MADHIQIGDISPRIQYMGDGAETAFTYPFPIFRDTDLEAYEDDTLKTLSADYGVSSAGNSAGGTVTFEVAPASGVVVTLKRNIAIARTSDFQESGEFRAKVINDELDTLTATLQQIESEQERSLSLSATDSANTMTLPDKAMRSGNFLAFDADGNPIASEAVTGVAASAFGASLVDDADASAARTTLGLDIGTDVLSPTGDGSGLTGVGATDAEKANIALNAFRIAINGGLSVQNMVDGIIDEFSDETGVDTATSSGEIYVAADDCYANTPAGTIEDGGHTAGTGTISSGYTRFDQTWSLNNNEKVTHIGIYSVVSGTMNLKIALQNSSTDLDIVYNENTIVHGGTGWEDFELATPYVVPASGTYRAGHFVNDAITNATATYTLGYYLGDATGSSEVYTSGAAASTLCRVTYAGATSNMVLVSGATTALAQPDTAFAVLWQQDVDAVTLNTDLKAYASRDAGVTWTEGALTAEATLSTGRILTGTADISAQPAGTSMKWKIETLNTKSQRLHGVGLEWS